MNIYNILIIGVIIAMLCAPITAEEHQAGYIDFECNGTLIPEIEERQTGFIEFERANTLLPDICLADDRRIIYNGDGYYIHAWALGSSINSMSRDGGEYGHVVHLEVPDNDPFVISNIGVHAQRYGIDGYTRFEIWDDDHVIYSNVIRNSEYSSLEWDGWNYVTVPDVIVYNDFYINICTGSTQDDGVFIVLDGDTGVCGSYRSYNDELFWNLDELARCDVNWKICAVEASEESDYDDGYIDGYDAGIIEAALNEVIGDVTGDGKVSIGDAVLLFNWVSFPNERGITYILR